MIYKAVLFGCMLLFVFSAVLFATEPTDITEQDNGKEITMQVDGDGRLVLTMAAGTGYSWKLDKIDENILEFGELRTEADHAQGMVGGPVKMIWSFKTKGSGTAKITAKLTRSWMPDEPAKVFEVSIRVVKQDKK